MVVRIKDITGATYKFDDVSRPQTLTTKYRREKDHV